MVRFYLPLFQNVCNFVHYIVHIADVFRRKAVGPFLSGLCAKNKRSHTRGKCVNHQALLYRDETFSVSFGRDTKSHWSLRSVVCVQEVNIHMHVVD